MKKIIVLLSVVLFLGLFLASPYIFDYWQNKSALEAAGGMSVYEGILASQMQKCKGSCTVNGVDTCCRGDYGEGCFVKPSIAPACLDYEMLVTKSAGGQKCATGYVLTPAQYAIANGAKNIILGGTVCTNLSVIASENGCLGCTAMVNDNKVYAFKNKLKAFSDFIIAGFKGN